MNNLSKIEPHAAKLESAASAMDAAGIGGHPSRGHAAILRTMAGDLRSQAALGRMPASFDSLSAVADVGDDAGKARATHLTLVQCVAKASSDDLGRLSTLRQRCSRLGLALDEFADKHLTAAVVDQALAAGSGSTSDKIAIKSALFREGLLSASGV
jgi:hypothetical protein